MFSNGRPLCVTSSPALLYRASWKNRVGPGGYYTFVKQLLSRTQNKRASFHSSLSKRNFSFRTRSNFHILAHQVRSSCIPFFFFFRIYVMICKKIIDNLATSPSGIQASRGSAAPLSFNVAKNGGKVCIFPQFTKENAYIFRKIGDAVPQPPLSVG